MCVYQLMEARGQGGYNGECATVDCNPFGLNYSCSTNYSITL
jgi:hypothetical protein